MRLRLWDLVEEVVTRLNDQYSSHGFPALNADTITSTAAAYIDRSQTYLQNGISVLTCSLACLLLALKATEGHGHVPLYSDVLHAARLTMEGWPQGIVPAVLVAEETRILNMLGWKLLAASPLHFAHEFRAFGLFTDVDRQAMASLADSDGPLVETQVWIRIKFFCRLANRFSLKNKYGSSLCAAAAVAASRHLVLGDRFCETYPRLLARRFGHEYEDVGPCVNQMLTIYCEMYDGTLPACTLQEYCEEDYEEKILHCEEDLDWLRNACLEESSEEEEHEAYDVIHHEDDDNDNIDNDDDEEEEEERQNEEFICIGGGLIQSQRRRLIMPETEQAPQEPDQPHVGFGDCWGVGAGGEAKEQEKEQAPQEPHLYFNGCRRRKRGLEEGSLQREARRKSDASVAPALAP